jgi:hypothetical protein
MEGERELIWGKRDLIWGKRDLILGKRDLIWGNERKEHARYLCFEEHARVLTSTGGWWQGAAK